MDSMFLMVDVLFAGSGLYVLYSYYLIKSKGIVKENLLMSKEVSINKCKDKEGYIKYMAPRILVFGIILVIIGVIGFVDDYFHIMGMGFLIFQAVGLAAIIYFAVCSKNSIKKFW